MSDPIADIIGDYRAFATTQSDLLIARGIDIAPYALSHLAVRVPDWGLYIQQRTLLERHATANLENVWNGRPISKIVLAEPLVVLDGMPVSLIELIPPVHQRVYRMGLEHLGIVVGERVDAFAREHRGPDRATVPECRQRAVLRALRGLHPRQVLPPLALRRLRPRRGDLRWLRPRRQLGPTAPRDRDRPEPAAAVTADRSAA
jgi:predicted metalloenzyme YecM